ncbi:MAG TPA: hypothetical protein VHR41_16025 [Gemmatimonadales bacterium]|jgi:hypothetical protein|nr:hypothetical protein [Gemmatimonadales bacterium]
MGARYAVAVLLALMGVVPARAAAQFRGRGSGLLQGPIEAGLRTGRDFENHAWSLGGQLRIPVRKNVELRPSADLFFPKHGSTGWQANGDAALRLGQGGGLYAGGGIAFVHLGDRGTETGYNLFFGLSTAPPLARTKPFVEFRWTFLDETSPFRLAVGFSRVL